MDAIAKVFGDAGIQWMGWALAVMLMAVIIRGVRFILERDDKRNTVLIDVVERNTTAINLNATARASETNTIRMLIEERLPKHG